ncbi:MAG TPA: winged helix-turn-helix transcriptional regulator [Firmicutes bacterium]|uniref:Winged helix-turn-helix transcriptional regulator n=1 Tax=Candidatus Fermentithermobacillus carboniphilus TaxID=3085328 RepID=A0AAT9LER5_9FIRM|nr:MAG: winged helix-turn-helix transcriptional regulator [Candidatus Fermentithermobacillus carboniphilus]HHW18509.1 winged helix-turn-helix transcriptional regulator [Candidatus Fermentithermobacillaceae bacterium]
MTPVYQEKAETLKALAHPVRLCIVRNLLDKRCNVGHMQECLGLPQSTVSQHLGILRARGIIRAEKVGQETYYRVVNEDAKNVVLKLIPRL